MTVHVLNKTENSLIRTVFNTLKHLYEVDCLKAQIRRERDQLAQMDDHQLRDIGLSRQEAQDEVHRSFHDVPEHRLISRL